MQQFDVFPLSDGSLVVILQSDLREGGATRVVAPVIPIGDISTRITDTDIRVEVAGAAYIVPVDLLSAMHSRMLAPERKASLSAYRDALTRATDLIFFGF